ncbi:MAG: tyrosine--tRNA ligase [Acutalibacteraceae bacterium]
MDIYKELSDRDLIAQVTNEKKVRELLKGKGVHFYIGFEPTADSLHVGHFVQIMVMARLQRAGHIPIILFGGGTGLIGDPSGKTDMRKMLTKEEINHNIECFKKQASRFLDLTPGKAIIVNNADWLENLKYIDFLREVGVHFSVNRMLAAECYKQRLEKGLTFFELNYMLMQSYDFLILNRRHNCLLELGGDDQWSNIIGGVELTRKMDKKEVFGLTFKLLTTSEGKKMGKTEKGALWIDKEKTSPYEFYQYWRNVNDKDVINCMNMLTFIPVEKIKEYASYKDEKINQVKEILAFEITKLVHGEDEAIKARETSKALFGNKNSEENMPTIALKESDFSGSVINILELIVKSEIAPSKSEARRLVQQGGISIDNERIQDINLEINQSDLCRGIIIKKGKKIFKKVILK